MNLRTFHSIDQSCKESPVKPTITGANEVVRQILAANRENIFEKFAQIQNPPVPFALRIVYNHN